MGRVFKKIKRICLSFEFDFLSKNRQKLNLAYGILAGNYKLQLYDPRTNGFAPSSPEIGMHVEIRDPEDKIIMSKVYSSEGKWTFTSHTPGEHVICLYTNSTKWFSGTQLRVHLDISVGEHAIDYANLAKNEKLSELQLRVRQLLDQVEQITKEQNYQRVSQLQS